MQPESVYVHIPFCAKKCHYCDFATYTLSGQPVDDYLDALEQEMALTFKASPAREVRTIFIGGGTPTILTVKQMERLLVAIERYFPNRSADLEFTVEANPGTLERDKLMVMRDGGVNRLSIGAQSFDDELLKAIGRDHDAKVIYDSVNTAQATNFDNISLDLMFGLPGQTVSMMDETLDAAFALGVQHFSAYALIVEENTLFHVLQRRGQFKLPTDDEEFAMYQLVRERMGRQGYEQYEISNFSYRGYESRHNRTYWLNEPYYGFGVGAHGYVQGVRYANVRGVNPYIQALKEGRLPRVEEYEVSETEAMENTMILGLRLLEGVSFGRFQKRFGTDLWDVYGEQIAELEQKRWLERDDAGVRLTASGLLWGNEVFARFLT